MWARMIAASPSTRQTPAAEDAPNWQAALRDAISSPAQLLEYLGIDPALPSLDFERLRAFPLRVPRGFAARMSRFNPQDPLFLQVWPSHREAEEVEGFTLDAVGDLDAARGDGVIQKYAGRALLITTGACAVHCRYCFRRHFPYNENASSREQWRPTLERIAKDTSVSEIILSGGDPLSLSNERLRGLLLALSGLSHIKRLRIHSRQPIVLPERIDQELVDLLRKVPQDKVMVVHANHANELDHTVKLACELLKDAGLTLLNQSVLLRGINDNCEDLLNLHTRLFQLGILPYYLHLMDRVQGAAHFNVSEARARQLMQDLMARSPGYLVPRLAREVPNMPSKQWIQW